MEVVGTRTTQALRSIRLAGVTVISAAMAATLACTTAAPSAQQTADTIYAGGDIVTVNDAQPTAEALAVKDGKILAVSTRSEVERVHKGTSTHAVDLAGRTLVPGFVDGHVHMFQFGAQAVGANLLSPPDGTVNTINDVVAKLQEFAKGPDVKRTGWIFGMGYDDALLGRHPTRDDLDKVSTDMPVMALHVSGHFSVVNSAGLRKIGYTAATEDPEGGVIRRRPGSQEPNGVLEELASIPHAFAAVSPTGEDDQLYFMQRGLEMAKRYGYTTAQEGRAFAANHAALARFAERGVVDIDIVSYIDYANRDLIRSDWHTPTYRNHYRIGGMKITLDGSPQGRTAWRTVPYLLPPDGQKPGYKGYPAFPDEKVLQALFDEAYHNKWQVLTHANGDAAVDQMIRGIRTAQANHGPTDLRPVLIHGQYIRQDQAVNASVSMIDWARRQALWRLRVG